MKPVPLRTSRDMKQIMVDGLPVLVSKTNHRKALIYWHGFPGPFRPQGDDEIRLADHAFTVAHSDYDFYYPLYTDSQLGSFDFLKSARLGPSMLDFVRRQKSYDSVTVVGQSWGAVIAVNAWDANQIHKLILITPFLGLPTGEAASKILLHYAMTYPSVLAGRMSDYLSQIAGVAAIFNPSAIMKNTGGRVRIIAGSSDEVVSLKTIKALLPADSKLIVMEHQGHDIKDRSHFEKILRVELAD